MYSSGCLIPLLLANPANAKHARQMDRRAEIQNRQGSKTDDSGESTGQPWSCLSRMKPYRVIDSAKCAFSALWISLPSEERQN